MAERLEKWPAIRESLARLRPEIGYLTLQTYYTDRAGQQVGRFDLTPRMIAHWLETGPEDEDDEEGLAAILAALEADVPAFPDDDFKVQNEPDDADEDQESDSEDESEDEESDDEGEFHEEEDAPEEVAEEAVPQTDAYEVVSAVRKFLLATCENNTPPGDTQKFRVRFYRPKGQQLWSTVIRYHSASVAEAAPTPSYTAPAAAPSPTELALSELLSMHNDDSPPPPPSAYPSLPKPDDLSKQIADEARSVQAKATRSNGGSKSAPWEVQTLLHLHGLHRSYAAMVLNTTREIVKVQGQAMRQQAQMLADSRNHADGLIDAMHVQKLNEIDRQHEYAQAQDAEATKAALGKEALSQLGLIGRVMMMKQAAAQGANGHGEYVEGMDPSMLGMEEHAGELEEPHDGQEVHQQEDILSYMEHRPDVVDTLNDPAVRAYLADPANVEQLRELATVMATMNGSPVPPPPTEAQPTDPEPANKE
jgi:hypothetical protein